jgi:hypothetical protein
MLDTHSARTNEQRRAALRRANEVRLARAAVKRRLQSGELALDDVLTNPGWMVETATVAEMLEATRWVGKRRTWQALRMCQVSGSRAVGELTPRQRAELVEWLRKGKRR